MVVSEYRETLTIRRRWNWNPITWSWLSYDMKVHTHVGGQEVIGTLTFKQRGPLSQTLVTYP